MGNSCLNSELRRGETTPEGNHTRNPSEETTMKPSLLLVALVCVGASWAQPPSGPGVGGRPGLPPFYGPPQYPGQQDDGGWGGMGDLGALFKNNTVRGNLERIWGELRGHLMGFGMANGIVEAFVAQNPWSWDSGTVNAFANGVFLLPLGPPELRTSARNSLYSNATTKDNIDKAIAAFQGMAMVLPVDSVAGRWVNNIVHELRTSKSVTEIMVQTLKPGQSLQDYQQKRDTALTQLTKSQGIEVIRVFHSYASVPVPDAREVFFGMLRWDSKKSVDDRNSIALNSPTPELRAFLATFDSKAYVQVRQIEGPYFDLATVARDGQVVVVAIRQVNKADEAQFQLLRRRYENLLASQDGVLGIYEFEVVSDSLLPSNANPNSKNLKVGIVVAQSKDKWQSAVNALSWDPLTAAYFATFTSLAYQYGVAV
ncbi:unnamed protein product [Darwinula stevensoni]|uniref:Uncharacterized protein n=1 Tax=Darwinula stevensoni TaxID=69355 RepID=A0A7R9AEA8_9CRUS|nr:unnamed protein product [Darwinula stevensoni]CAG0902195.1 unnamed protein product [Darwinula stevensoni]